MSSIRPDSYFIAGKTGNFLDDLKALSEDMEELEMDGDSHGDISVIGIASTGNLLIIQGPNNVFIDRNNIDTFIMNLRKKQATAKRRAK